MNEGMILGNEISFKEFLLRNKRNKTTLWIAAIALVIQFSIFKYLYPYPSFIFADSFSYITAAYYNVDVNQYMVGYSRFLRLFSVFTTSDTALVAFTYLFIQCSALFLLFTLFYFYRPGKVVQIILLCFTMFSPLSLHLANLISSDAFFLGLSLIWFALLIWIIHNPSKQIIIAHAIVLFIAFTVRYNALIYPFISLMAFWLSRLSLRQKVIGISMGVMLCGMFVFYTTYRYKQLTGQWQYSPFSGWQLANNSIYGYKYVNSADRKSVPKKFERLDQMVTAYFDASRNEHPHPQEYIPISTIYMWTPGLPLVNYMESVFQNDTAAKYLKKWSTMGPLYSEYGVHIIRTYPRSFARYFLWPNFLKYYAPPLEFLEQYNSGRDSASKFAQVWFNYKSSKVKMRVKDNEVRILVFFPALSGFTNVVMFSSLICFMMLGGWRIKGNFRLGILMAATVWVLNAAFTIFASSVALRFQSFPILLTTIFTVFLLEWIWLGAFTTRGSQSELGISKIQENELSKNVIA